ncbi:MAG: Gfo/Idh/MocA family oxidoreductase [Algicola sp.]|nr:Gfo/Idh/MocA family oxidoreductase [Algicola sp.]
MRTINWGIIGLGNIATKFAQDLLTVEGAKLYAVASRNQQKANGFATKFDVEIAYSDYESLASDPNIDAVYIATPHALHKAHSLMCLEKKKAVLCEKPFAMNLSEVDTMIASAKDNRTLLMEAMWTYFLPHYQFALEQLKKKTFGAITKIEADFGFKPDFNLESRVFKKSLGGGSLLDIGIYPIFAALSTLGEPLRVDSKATFFDNGVDASCFIILNYANDVEAHLKSTLTEKTATEAIFYCERGTIKINSRFHEPSSVTLISGGEERTCHFECHTHGYDYETRHFNDLLRTEALESPIMTFDFSRKLMRTLDLIRHQIGLHYE